MSDQSKPAKPFSGDEITHAKPAKPFDGDEITFNKPGKPAPQPVKK